VFRRYEDMTQHYVFFHNFQQTLKLASYQLPSVQCRQPSPLANILYDQQPGAKAVGERIIKISISFDARHQPTAVIKSSTVSFDMSAMPFPASCDRALPSSSSPVPTLRRERKREGYMGRMHVDISNMTDQEWNGVF